MTDRLGAQGTVCAGGRYDRLVAQLGGTPTPAVGLAMGFERLIALLVAEGRKVDHQPWVYIIAVGERAETEGLVLAERLRDRFAAMSIRLNCGGGSFKSQFKRADKSGAELALVIGEEEAVRREVAVKYLRQERPQATVAMDEIGDHLSTLVTSQG